MTKIAVFFNDPGKEAYPFTEEEYRTAYRQLAEMIQAKGSSLHFVRSMHTHQGGLTFSEAWTFRDGELIDVPGPVTFDLLWNKGAFVANDDSTVINHPELDALCRDKWRTYQAFPDLHMPSRLIASQADVAPAIAELTTERLVLKPLSGFGGDGVVIEPRAEIATHVTAFPCILQAFIDTSAGIPGIVDGLHDLRMVVVDGTVALSYVRTPPQGSYAANVARGGREIGVPVHQLPPEALAIKEQVDTVLAPRFPRRFYGIDVGRDVSGAWKVIELNSKPGVSPLEAGPEYPAFFQVFTDFLISAGR